MNKVIALLLTFALVSLTLAAPRIYSQDPAPMQPMSEPVPLTNGDISDLLKIGLTSEIVIAKIKGSPNRFDTSPSALAELKNAGVPDLVILAMVQASSESSSSSVAEISREVSMNVPDGLEIEIQLTNTISGQEAKIGDIVDFTVVHAVQIDGNTLFERDASARARITTAKPSGRWGRAGKLEWAMQDVKAVDGTRVPARFTKRELGDSKGGTVAVAAVATTVLLGPVGLLWGLKKGKAAIIPAGNRYSVFVHGDAVIKGKPGETSAAAGS